jgi:hypothetical protein
MDGGDRVHQRTPTDPDVDRVVQQLRAIDHESAWTRILEVGRVVFEGLVGGDEVYWRSRRSTKNLSLRRLVEHPACPYKKTALGDAVNVHLFVRRNRAVTNLTTLTPTHVMRAAGLPNDQAIALLRKAADSGWTVRELGAQVQALRRAGAERRGRPRSLTEHRVETLARHAATSLRTMLERLAYSTLDDRHAISLCATLDEVTELVALAREQPLMARRSGIVTSLPKSHFPVQMREEVAGLDQRRSTSAKT